MKQLILAIAIAATITGCAKSADADKPAATATAAAAAETTTAAPSAAPAGALSGKVLETMNSGGYTYIRLETASGEAWAAVGQADVKVGSEISITPQMTMTDFESPTLKRKFASIVFGTLGQPGAAMPAAMPATGDSPHGGAMGSNPHAGGMGGNEPAAEVPVAKVAKAEGPDARTIEQLWAQKDALKGKRVVVRGVVVKFSSNIMGKNWLHLRDGSGSADKKNDDITVTTTSVASKGDTVLVTGKIATNVDIGAGYAYDVMIEDASVAK
ncbi:MAG: nucleotide-binding protein [Thermoanaerobaculia bacterium]|jgi:hypothetical protein